MKSLLAACNRRQQAQTSQDVCRVQTLPLVWVPFSDWLPLATEKALPFRVTALARTWVQVRL